MTNENPRPGSTRVHGGSESCAAKYNDYLDFTVDCPRPNTPVAAHTLGGAA